MTCIDDGILRAHLDGELAGADLQEVTEHSLLAGIVALVLRSWRLRGCRLKRCWAC